VNLLSGGGRGGERECGSGDRRWRKVGEATFVWCGEIMVTPQKMGSAEKIWVPTPTWGL